jgi:flagellar basal-body rod protein FlgG
LCDTRQNNEETEMIDSLYIGATGMNAQQTNIDTVANNLANVNTTAYKRGRVEFEDLLYRAAGVGAGAGTRIGTGSTGMGTMVAGVSRIFNAGDVKKTDQTYDLAINGQGFFEVVQTDGSVAYTRNGAFQIDADGFLATQNGLRLSSQIQVSPDAQQVRIASDGRVFAQLPNVTQETEVARLELANFANPAGLSALGDNLYLATDKSGPAVVGNASENGLGSVQQGFLESSNVKLIDEMIGLILAQRAYEINAKVVQASDEMLSISNNLYRP